ncbi:SUKH-3 domain-containing protein [Yinghuangia sp. YIM S09857]|uniref:SUKH-3 domain-containing protein n=1 Tax=Yinghuangia sp. YIM S09857 TaxID=3436929 RepID=UPI003F53B1F7
MTNKGQRSPEAEHNFSDDLDHALRGIGWTPGRRVAPEQWLTSLESDGLRRHDAATEFLAEFGGLARPCSGPGITSAREAFDLNPALCEGEGGRFRDWSAHIDRVIFPVGEIENGRAFLGIDETSELYLVETCLASFDQMPYALEGLVLGYRPRHVATWR